MRLTLIVSSILAGCLPSLGEDCTDGGCLGSLVCRAGVCVEGAEVSVDAAADATVDAMGLLPDARVADAAADAPEPEIPDVGPLRDTTRPDAAPPEGGCSLDPPTSIGPGSEVAVRLVGGALAVATISAAGISVREQGGMSASDPAPVASDLDLVGTGAHWVATARGEAGSVALLSLARPGGFSPASLDAGALRGPTLAARPDARVVQVYPTATELRVRVTNPLRPRDGDALCVDCGATAQAGPWRPAAVMEGGALWVVHPRVDRRLGVTRVDGEGVASWVSEPVAFPLEGDVTAAATGEGAWVVASSRWYAELRLDAPAEVSPAPWDGGRSGRVVALAGRAAWFGVDPERRLRYAPRVGGRSVVLLEEVDAVDAAAGEGGVTLGVVRGGEAALFTAECW